MTANPTGADVASFMGRATDPVFVAQCDVAVSMARSLAVAYTRGQGFPDADSCHPDLRPIVIMRAARMAANPLSYVSETTDGTSAVDPSAAAGWSLGEQLIMNGFRRRAT